MFLQLFNTSMRLASLGLKLLLTVYMGKYLGLSDMGTFGLVAAAVAISIPLLGFRLDYVVLREIVGKEPQEYVPIIRDELVFYILNYLVVAGCITLFVLGHGIEADLKIIQYAVALAALESFATITSTCIGSLKRPVASNFLFFLRSAAWVILAIGLGLYSEAFRNAETIFTLWVLGIAVSLAVTAYLWRDLPWMDAIKNPIHWSWIFLSVKKAIPLWLSGICGALALNVDRFFVESFLSREMVGVASFYASFMGSIAALLASGVFSFKYPYLIEAYTQKKMPEFHSIAKSMFVQSCLSAAAICISIGIAIPMLGDFMGKEEFSTYASVLWLMLLGAWIRAMSETFYYIQYARHQDRSIWVGTVLQLLPAIGLNIILMPHLGFISVGISACASSVVLAAWRIGSVLKFKEPSLMQQG